MPARTAFPVAAVASEPVSSAIDPRYPVGPRPDKPRSHFLDHVPVTLLGCLGRRPEDAPDRAPGNPGCAGPSDRIDDLPFASGTIHGGSLKEILLDGTLVGLIGFILLESSRQVIAVIEYVLD